MSLIWWSPRTTTSTRPRPSAITGKAFSSAPSGSPSLPATSAIVVRPGVGTSSGAASGAGSSTGAASALAHLDVGGVAGRQRDVVLARGARRHVLVGADAAHHPDVRLDPVPLEPDPVEDAVVGAAEALVVLVEAGAVAVEGVGVLHDELARAQQPGARPRLVAPLGLEVVEAERELAVGAHDVRDVERHDLLVRQRQHHLGAAAVLQLEDLVDVVAPAALPQLGRVEHRHQQLLAADARSSPRARSARRSRARASRRACSSRGPRRAGG